MSDLAVGAIAPDFSLLDDAGKTVKLSALRGKWVVLTFYAEDDTPTCTVQMCSFRDEFAGFQDADALVFGVSPDEPATHASWRKREKFAFGLLSDPGDKVATRYGAHGEKIMYGRPVVGVIRTTLILDPKGRVAWMQRKLRSPGHGARVLAELRKVQAGYL